MQTTAVCVRASTEIQTPTTGGKRAQRGRERAGVEVTIVVYQLLEGTLIRLRPSTAEPQLLSDCCHSISGYILEQMRVLLPDSENYD